MDDFGKASGAVGGPSSVDVRILGPEDFPPLREMLALFGEAFEDPETYTARQPGDDYLACLLSGGLFLAVAAFDEGRVVGGIAAYVLPKFEQARSEIYLYDVAVAESHRRRGIATAMIEALQASASALGAWILYVQADRDDEPAIALYDKLGRREAVLHFDIDPARE